MRVATKRLFSAAMLLTTLLAAEAIARLAFRRPPAPFVASANQKLIYELNPSYPGIKPLGTAQGPIDLSTLHDRSVIAVIGDSHAYSIEMSNHAYGFPARLEHALNADDGERFTVLDFGVPGYNTVQSSRSCGRRRCPFEPDLIVLQSCINDEHISNYIQPRYPRINRAIHRSVLATTAWTTFLYSDFGRRRVLPYAEHAPDLLLFAPGLVGTPVSRDPDPAHGPTHPPEARNGCPPVHELHRPRQPGARRPNVRRHLQAAWDAGAGHRLHRERRRAPLHRGRHAGVSFSRSSKARICAATGTIRPEPTAISRFAETTRLAKPSHATSESISRCGDVAEGPSSPTASVRATDTRRVRFEVFRISFLILFLELACIRWFGSTVIFLTFFTNIVLMACFLGVSVGCLAAGRRMVVHDAFMPLAARGRRGGAGRPLGLPAVQPGDDRRRRPAVAAADLLRHRRPAQGPLASWSCRSRCWPASSSC